MKTKTQENFKCQPNKLFVKLRPFFPKESHILNVHVLYFCHYKKGCESWDSCLEDDITEYWHFLR